MIKISVMHIWIEDSYPSTPYLDIYIVNSACHRYFPLIFTVKYWWNFYILSMLDHG